MLLTALIASMLAQDPAPGVPADKAPAQQREIVEKQDAETPSRRWQRMHKDERERILERQRTFEDMPPEAQAEMRRRYQALDGFRRMALHELTDEERAALRKMPEEQRKAEIDKRVRAHLEQLSSDLALEFPDRAERIRKMPPGERILLGRQTHERRRIDDSQRKLAQAVEKGWLGTEAAEFLADASPEEIMEVVAPFHKREELRKLDREDGWKSLGLDASGRERLSKLPPREFFPTLHRLRIEHGLERPRFRGRPGEPGLEHRRFEGKGPRSGDRPHGDRLRREGQPPGGDHPPRGGGRRPGF